MSGRVMVLGAGVYQLPVIKKAREMGLYTIAVSIPGRYPGFAAADEACHVDTTDTEAVLALAKQKNIDAVFTTGTDVALRTIARVSAELGLPGPSVQGAENCTDKALMKEALLAGGVRTGAGRRVFSTEEAKDACAAIGYPAIFKCVDQSGSRGITRVDGPDAISAAFEYALNASKKDYILAEEFIEGYEVGLDGYAGGGEAFLITHGRVNHYNGRTDVPIGHYLPGSLPAETEADVHRQAKGAIRALGLDGCFVNMDIMLRDGKAYILEVGARTGATCIPEIIAAHCGFDYYGKIVDAALGRPVNFMFTPGPACIGELLMSPQDGIIKEIRCPNPLPAGVLQLELDYAAGDAVRRFMVGPDRIGQILATGPDMDAARAALEDAKNQLRVVVA